MQFLKKPTLRRIELDVQALESMHEGDSADRWQKRLLEAGMLTDVPRGAADRDDWSPHRALARLARAVGRLRQVEDSMASIRQLKPFRSGEVQGEVWWLIGGSAYAAVAWLGSFFWGLAVSAVMWGLLGVVGGIHVVRFDRRKKVRLAELEVARDRIRGELVAEVRGVCRRSFVSAVGSNLIVCRPHQRWLTVRYRDVARAVADHRPDSADPVATLARDLDAEIRRLAERFEEVGHGEIVGWTSEGLDCDVAAFAQRLTAAGARVPPTVERLDELLRGS